MKKNIERPVGRISEDRPNLEYAHTLGAQEFKGVQGHRAGWLADWLHARAARVLELPCLILTRDQPRRHSAAALLDLSF